MRISQFQNMLTYYLMLLLKMKKAWTQSHLQIKCSIYDWTFLWAIISGSEKVIKKGLRYLICSNSLKKGIPCVLTAKRLFIQIPSDIWNNEEILQAEGRNNVTCNCYLIPFFFFLAPQEKEYNEITQCSKCLSILTFLPFI